MLCNHRTMISRSIIYFFLCIFVQQQSCSPVPTNTKIRHDVRRSSFQDDSTTPTSSSSTSKSTSTTRSTSVSTSSSDIPRAGRLESATPLVSSGSTDATHVPTTTDFIKLAEIFEEPVESNGKVKTKRDVPLVRSLDEHEGGNPLIFKPERNENEDDMEVAETHLFRPLFKYKSVNSERRHIRQPAVATTTTK